MDFSSFETHHFFENRLYVASCPEGTLKHSVTDPKDGTELYGASVRSYSKPIGFILSLFGVAAKVEVNNKEFYVNCKSVSKLVLRLKEVEAEEAKIDPDAWNPIGPSSQQIVAGKLHEIYKEHAKTGYDESKVDFLKNELNTMVNGKDNLLKFVQMTKTLIGELEKNYKKTQEK